MIAGGTTQTALSAPLRARRGRSARAWRSRWRASARWPSSPACWRRSSAARPSACAARSIRRSRSPTTSTRRSSSSRGCRACSPGALVGAALASAGVVFQALLRNPLATPFTLGVSAGASLGAMLVIILGGTLAVGPWSPVPPPASPARASRRRSSTRWPTGRGASCRPRCCCWPASRSTRSSRRSSCSCSTWPTSPRWPAPRGG